MFKVGEKSESVTDARDGSRGDILVLKADYEQTGVTPYASLWSCIRGKAFVAHDLKDKQGLPAIQRRL